MLTLNIQAPDTEALWAQLRGILQGEVAKPAVEAALARPENELRDPVDVELEARRAADPKPKTRKKAEPAAEPAKEPAKEPEPKAEEAPKPATLDDLRAALMALSKAKGEQVVWELMKDFDVQKASAVPEDKRAEVIAAANKKAGE